MVNCCVALLLLALRRPCEYQIIHVDRLHQLTPNCSHFILFLSSLLFVVALLRALGSLYSVSIISTFIRKSISGTLWDLLQLYRNCQSFIAIQEMKHNITRSRLTFRKFTFSISMRWDLLVIFPSFVANLSWQLKFSTRLIFKISLCSTHFGLPILLTTMHSFFLEVIVCIFILAELN